ncbi:hypothetical protein [Parvimonas sp. C2]|uniref:hypothetical protein n=1 Tax=Parvimonas sp. C2 TaxID=3110692 RepID=UPI002B4623AA|nr:hypothetical protein [Parvimonas sp. C2]MEB3072657.1 hypothetical protein [Parvimonas sp. C2]
MIKLIFKEFFKNLLFLTLIYLIMFNYVNNKVEYAVIFVLIALTTGIAKANKKYKNGNKKM